MSPRRAQYKKQRRASRGRLYRLAAWHTITLLSLLTGSAASAHPIGEVEEEEDSQDEGPSSSHGVTASSSRDVERRGGLQQAIDGSGRGRMSHPLIDLDLQKALDALDIDYEKGKGSGDNRHHRWDMLQADWNADRKSISVDSDSRGTPIKHMDPGSKGKGRAAATPFSQQLSTSHDTETAKIASTSKERLLPWTGQRSPFHASQVGTLASRAPSSIGLFRPDYPFLPSGRKRRFSNFPDGNDEDLLLSRQAEQKLPLHIAHSNILKHGWSASLLDDDVRLSIPDETRRARQTSKLARQLWGKKWFRWKPGEGYVLSWTKDLSVYRRGPGIALGQLLPPKEKPYTSSLPLIPNDSKRDFAYMMVLCIAFFALVALLLEARWGRTSNRKGKQRLQNASTQDRGTSLGTSLLWTRSPPSSSRITYRARKARQQRTKAQHLRDLCKVALFKSVSSMGSAASNTSSGLASMRWSPATSEGVSSVLSNGRVTRRTLGVQVDTSADPDGVSIEMLEKGGVDGSHLVTPVIDKGTFTTQHLHNNSVPTVTIDRAK